MRLIKIMLMVFCFVYVALPSLANEKDYYFTPDDHQVLTDLSEEISQLNGNLSLLRPIFTKDKRPQLIYTFQKSSPAKFDIRGLSFNGLDGSKLIKLRQWQSQGKRELEVSFTPKADLRPGYNYLLVKYWNFGETCALIIPFIIEGEPAKDKGFVVDKQVTRLFGRLYKAQQQLSSFSARLRAGLENYDTNSGETDILLDGQFSARGPNKLRVTLTAAPTCRNRSEGKTYVSKDDNWQDLFPQHLKIDRNHLGPYNLLFYFDYFAIFDGYNWEVLADDGETVFIRGYASHLLQRPYEYLLVVDKEHALPLKLLTFFDTDQVFGVAEAKYKEFGKVCVPIFQTTNIKFADKKVQVYTLDLSQEIEINKIPVEREGGI